MKKHIALIIKDIKILYKNPVVLIFSLGIPILYLFLFNFMVNSSGENLKLYVQNELSGEFDGKDEITLEYLEAPIPLSIEYVEKDSLLSEFEKGKLPIIYYIENDENIIYLNTNKEKSALVYSLLREKFYPITEKKFILKKKFSMNYALLTIVLNFLLLFSSMNYGTSMLHHEIQKHNILLVLKSGISKAELLLSKLACVLIIQLVSFGLFYSLAVSTGMLTFSFSLLVYLPVVVIPTATVGLFFSSITANDMVKGYLPMLLWFPTIFYSVIKDSLNPFVEFILKLDPLILLTELVEQIIRNDVSMNLVFMIAGITVILFFLSLVFMKRTIIKSM